MSTQENPPGSGRSRGREIALNVGAIAGLICVVVAGVSFLFGIKPLVFRSGSMSPEIPTGALALSKSTPASNLHVGDVVSVQTESGTRITHRIHEVLSSDGTTSALVLKGDANQDADVMPYTVTEADRVFFSVPGLGYAVSWLSTPIATFLGGALVGGVMVIAFGRRSAHKDDDHTDGESRRGEASSVEEAHEPARPIERVQSAAGAETDSARYSSRSWMSRKGVVAAGALSLAALMGTSVGTSAAFTDTALVSGSSFASFSTFTPAPLYVGCSRAAGAEAWGADRIDFKWKHLGPGYTYDIQLINDRGTSTTLTSPSLPANKGDIITKSWTSPDLKGYTATGLDKYVYVEVRSRRSFANGTVQTGPAWTGEKINAYSQVDSYCSGKHETGPISPSSAGGELPAARMAQQTEALTTTTPNTTTTTPNTTTTTPNTTTTTPNTTTTTPNTTTTTPTAPKLVGASASPAGTYVAGKSGLNAVIRDSAGEEVFSRPVSGDAVVQWDSTDETLWIVDGGKIYRVAAGIWNAVLVDPEATTVPDEIAALIK